jgi:hypothetical protein
MNSRSATGLFMKEGVMQATRSKPKWQDGLIRIHSKQTPGCRVTRIKSNRKVDVRSIDGYSCFWTAGREIRVGPRTPEQAEKLSEDLGYDAVV